MSNRNKGYWNSYWRKRLNNPKTPKEISKSEVSYRSEEEEFCSVSDEMKALLLFVLIVQNFPSWIRIFLYLVVKLEMLPVAFGLYPESEKETLKKGPGLGEFPISERFEFLRSLQPCREIVGISRGRRYDYRAFIFNDRAIVDSLGYGNALFTFKVDDLENWIEEVESFKHQLDLKILLKSGSVRKRIIHRGDWKTRVEDFLTSPSV